MTDAAPPDRLSPLLERMVQPAGMSRSTFAAHVKTSHAKAVREWLAQEGAAVLALEALAATR